MTVKVSDLNQMRDILIRASMVNKEDEAVIDKHTLFIDDLVEGLRTDGEVYIEIEPE